MSSPKIVVSPAEIIASRCEASSYYGEGTNLTVRGRKVSLKLYGGNTNRIDTFEHDAANPSATKVTVAVVVFALVGAKPRIPTFL